MNMKAAASLTGSLLARKGAAYPAAYSAPTTSPDSSDGAAASDGNRAYNDPRVIASAPPAPVQSTPPNAAAGQQLQDGRFAKAPAGPAATPTEKVPLFTETPPASDASGAADPVAAEEPTLAQHPEAGTEGVGLPQVMDKMGRVRLSVRLDPDRYLRVKMASARTRWSAQDIVIAALDRYLGGAANKESGGSGEDEGHGEPN